ncbi:clusterin-like protein 1 isoform X1 [Acipenser ruthenus]|uniref:clusterin-like protein 1 isoform X1 n=2 Tax=Acipenser ruthenus TaxID=7906 RepID=UPI002740C1AA|nr:clusterin-like protein 1 isoform X1 [Acipenser ruthenus]
MKMKSWFLLAICLTWLGVSQSRPGGKLESLSEETLKKLSIDGEKFVDEEVKRALFGVKQMKEIVEQNEEKHEHLMKSLRRSSEKKQGALQLAEEVKQKLEEAKDQCQSSLKTSWDECRPCLEVTCKSFYTSNCRRGFSTFSSKVETFFREMSPLFINSHENKDLVVNQDPESVDVKVVQIEDYFNKMISEVSNLFNQSMELFHKMHEEFDQSFQAAFTSELHTAGLNLRAHSHSNHNSSPGFLESLGLGDVLESFVDFGRRIFEEFSSVITEEFRGLQESMSGMSEKKQENDILSSITPSMNRQLCRDLRRNSSECWQLQSKCQSCQVALFQDCPSLPELHSELNEISHLINVSSQQYEEVLQIVQHHTEDTVSWIKQMAQRFGWVAELANTTVEHESVFSITTVLPHSGEGNPMLASYTTVEVNVLNSPTFIFNVPGELEIEDPAFIKYVAQEALGLYKEMSKKDSP